jgi:hypothetical protein
VKVREQATATCHFEHDLSAIRPLLSTTDDVAPDRACPRAHGATHVKFDNHFRVIRVVRTTGERHRTEARTSRLFTNARKLHA